MRKEVIAIFVVLAAALLSACGGDDAPVPSIAVTLSAASGGASVRDYDTETTFSLSAKAVANGNISTPAITDLQYDKAVFASVIAKPGSTPNTYDVTATTLPNLAIKDHSGSIAFRLCQDAACTKVYAGSTVSYAYKLTVKLGDWVTYQRNAAHTGYVPITLDPAKFTKAWAWKPDRPYDYVTRVVTGDGSVFFSNRYTGEVFSFNEIKGTQNWVRHVDAIYGNNGPAELAYEDGKIYVPTSKRDYPSSDIVIKALNASDGSESGSFIEPGQAQLCCGGYKSVQPVVHKGALYLPSSSDPNNGKLYAFEIASAAQKWLSSASVNHADYTRILAIDSRYAYYYTGASLAFFNVKDGVLSGNIPDPYYQGNCLYNKGAPIVNSMGNAIVKSCDGKSFGDGYRFTYFDVQSRSVNWVTEQSYETTPALSKGMLYSIRNRPDLFLDAISEINGSVLWSLKLSSLPSSLQYGEMFDGNVIVTENLIFASTDLYTYAFDLGSHKIVWSYPYGGDLAISANYILYINSNHVYEDPVTRSAIITDRVTAIKLR